MTVGSEMKVAIIGATGGIGRIMVRKALERGHEITAAVRNPSSLSGSYERLRVAKADVMRNQQTLEAGFSRHGEGAESYLKALGSEQGWPPTSSTATPSRSTMGMPPRQDLARELADLAAQLATMPLGTAWRTPTHRNRAPRVT
jgi:NAD(P)-dependent dehydrogenase (short-subunit alcohol dehydrogenase family)